MVIEYCKKIEPVVVKLRSKTNIELFSEHGVYKLVKLEMFTEPGQNEG